ncbi:MAG: hypothetical protein ABSE71_00545 [Candidatus Micrarchaeaceae archaeon]|jgi:hypothetical protein|nr:hypothetical protein [Candidatus Micrarchaeota archaeon]HII10309.1 hypothetical protein [Candidatus Micrarchaeota archaeon]
MSTKRVAKTDHNGNGVIPLRLKIPQRREKADVANRNLRFQMRKEEKKVL